MHELIPREMAQYRIADGRVYFTAPKLFEASLCIKGAKKEDGWFFDDVEFHFNVGGDVTGMQGVLETFRLGADVYSLSRRVPQTPNRSA